METQSVEYPQCTLADSFLRSGAARLVAYPFRMRQSDGHSSRSRPNWRKINQRPLQWEASSKKKKKKRKSKSKSVISESNRYSSDAGSATRTQLHQPPFSVVRSEIDFNSFIVSAAVQKHHLIILLKVLFHTNSFV